MGNTRITQDTIIYLDDSEWSMCEAVGIRRNKSCYAQNRKLEPGRKDIGIERHIIGCLGEYSLAKFLGIKWLSTIGALDTYTGDVEKYQVKTITDPNNSLIVRQHDSGEFPFVLCVLYYLDRIHLKGWYWGYEAKQEQFWREKKPDNRIHQSAYFVPQHKLLDIHTLP